MHIIAVANQKGGCGKTTTAINLGACLGLKGKNTLLIDLDPQAHATIGVSRQRENFPKTIADVLLSDGKSEISLAHLVRPVAENFGFIPSSAVLAEAEQRLIPVARRQEKLWMSHQDIQQLSPVPQHERLWISLQDLAACSGDAYDYVIIDCPPSTGLLTENALCACDEALLTIETSFFALHGIARLLDFIQVIKEKRTKPLQLRALATMYDRRKKIANEVLQNIRSYFGDLLYQTVIRVNVKLEEAASFGLAITAYSKRCTGYEDYMALAEEVIAASSSHG